MSNPKQGVVTTLREASGWDALDLDRRGQLDEDSQRQLREHCERVHRVFQNDDAKVFLEHLMGKYLMRPIVNANDTAFAAGIREGQASVIREILTDIECAKLGVFGGE